MPNDQGKSRLPFSRSHYESMIEASRLGTWEWDRETGELKVNDYWCHMLGYQLEDLSPITMDRWRDLVHPEDVAHFYQSVDAYLAGETPWHDCVIRMRHRDGHWCWMQDRGKVVVEPDHPGNARRLVGTRLDITGEREAQHQLTTLAESLPGIIYSCRMEPDGRIWFPYTSRRTIDFYDLSPEQVQDDASVLFNMIHPEDWERFQETVHQSAESLSPWNFEYRVVVGGQVRWLEGIAQPEREPDGAVIWHGMVVDIDSRKRMELELERLSTTDMLTGLYNRRFIMSKLEELAQHSERYDSFFTIVCIDIDHFKSINDTHGHPAGDYVLERIGAIIGNRVRKTDFAARIGGEEFMILLPDTTNDNGYEFAEMLRDEIEQETFEIEGQSPVQITMSAGIVPFRGKADRLEKALSLCDKSLYSAKEGGRNRVVMHSME